MNNLRTTIFQRASLLALSLLLIFIILELGLRLAGGILLGFEELRNRTQTPENKSYRILCLGESTTMMGGLSAYPRQLEEILNRRMPQRRFEVINRGLAGTTSDVILSRLETYLDNDYPDAVVLMMGINDTKDTPVFDARKRNAFRNFIKNLRIRKLAAWMDRSLKQGHRNQLVCESLGKFYEKEGRLDLARELYEKAIVSQPKKSWGYQLLYEFYKNQNKPELALEVYQRALKRNPSKTWSYILLSQAYSSQAQYGQAFEILNSGIAHGASPEEINLEIATVLVLQESFDEALVMLGPSIAYGHAQAAAYDQAARAYLGLKKLGEAKEYFRKTFEADPVKGQFAVDWLIAQEEFKMAEEVLQNRLSLEPDNSQLVKAMAVLLSRLGKPDEAQKYFDIARSLDEDFYHEATKENYRKLIDLVSRKGVEAVAVQYPIRSVRPLKAMLSDFSELHFVDNELLFQSAVEERGFDAVFADSFAGDFGHCTAEGNRLLAENIASTIINIININ